MGEATPDRQPNRSSPNDIRREFVSFLFDFVLCALCFFFFYHNQPQQPTQSVIDPFVARHHSACSTIHMYICTHMVCTYVCTCAYTTIVSGIRAQWSRVPNVGRSVHCPLSTVHSDCKKLSKKKNEYKLMLFFFIVIQIVLCRNYNYIIRCLQRGGNFPIASVQTSRTHTPTKTWPTCNTTTTHTHTHMHRYIVDIRLYAIRSEWSYKKKKNWRTQQESAYTQLEFH